MSDRLRQVWLYIQKCIYIYCDGMWSLWVEANLCRFFLIICLYIYGMYSCWRSSYQEGRIGIPLTGLTLSHFCSCPKPGPGFPMSYVVLFCVQWVQLWWEVIVRFVDIGRIVAQHCLNFLFHTCTCVNMSITCSWVALSLNTSTKCCINQLPCCSSLNDT